MNFKTISDFISYYDKCIICNEKCIHSLSGMTEHFNNENETIIFETDIFTKSNEFSIGIESKKVINLERLGDLSDIFNLNFIHIESSCPNENDHCYCIISEYLKITYVDNNIYCLSDFDRSYESITLDDNYIISNFYQSNETTFHSIDGDDLGESPLIELNKLKDNFRQILVLL